MNKLKFNLVFFSLLLILNFCSCLHFIIEEGEKKCFLEELPRDTLLLVKWKITFISTNPRSATPNDAQKLIKIVAIGPEKELLLQKSVSLDGRVAFTTKEGGEHEICLSGDRSNWFGAGTQMKVEIDIETGSNAVDYGEVAQVEHLNGIQIELRKLNDKAREILKAQAYLKVREWEMRDESESMNGKVVWWSIGETILLVCAGLWQIRHLRNFFHQKKLV
eukprot:TRINITY_DN936_c0_g1_i1.p1 TRINITY_DN936_c0_g1~~TRINITY_DN936_c0_g1_i1.p1  ORF type:complete len:236 (-),score=111.94 TRINITY_DN936_c0_g1_i1:242-901(-)